MSLVCTSSSPPLTSTFQSNCAWQNELSCIPKQLDPLKGKVSIHSVLNSWQKEFTQTDLSPLRNALVEHIQIKSSPNGELIYVSEELRPFLFQQHKSLWAKITHLWSQNRTALGRVVQEIGNAANGAQLRDCLERLGERAISQANQEALQLTQMSKASLSKEEDDIGCLKNAITGIFGSIATQNPIPALLGAASCMTLVKADDAINPIPDQLFYIGEPYAISINITDVFQLDNIQLQTVQQFDRDTLSSWSIFPSGLSASGTPILSQRGFYSIRISATSANMVLSTVFRMRISERVTVKTRQPQETISLSNYGTPFTVSFFPSQLFSFKGLGCFLKLTSSKGKIDYTFTIQQSYTNYNTPGSAVGISLIPTLNKALIADTNALRSIDITNPIQPQSTGSFGAGAFFANRVAWQSIAGNFVSFLLVERTLISGWITVATVNSCGGCSYPVFPAQAFDLIAVAGLLLIGDGDAGLQIMTPTGLGTSGVIVGAYDTPGTAFGIGVSNKLALVADGDSGLQIIDFTDSTRPYRTGNLTTFGIARGVVASGLLAIVADGAAGLHIIDFSNSSHPHFVANLTLPGYSYDVIATGALALVACDDFGLQIVDISNPFKPYLVANIDTPGNATDLSLMNSQVYIADGTEGLEIVDFSQNAYTFTLIPTLENAGNYEFTLTGTNDLGVSESSTFLLRIEGAPIVIGNIPPQVAFVNRPFSSMIKQDVFFDPNFDSLSYSANYQGLPLPNWLGFSSTGVFLGTPSTYDVGFVNITVNANDGHEGTVSVNMDLTITHPPILVKQIPNQLANIGTPFSFAIESGTFIDPDGDFLTFTAQQNNGNPLPSWVSFGSSSNTFSGLPTIPTKVQVQIDAIESHGGKTSGYFDLIAEHFPVAVKTIPNQLLAIGAPFIYRLPDHLFEDADQDPLVYFATGQSGGNLPSWAFFNPSLLTFSGVPTPEINPLNILVIARDIYGAEGTVSFQFVLDYFPVPNPKYTLTKQVINIGSPWQFSIPSDLFLDQDDPTLTLSVTLNDLPLPDWLSFQNNLFSGVPKELSKSSIKITATDSKGAQASSTFYLTVDQFPIVMEKPPRIIAAINEPFSYVLPSNTFSSATLSYRAQQLRGANKLNTFESVEDLPLWLKFDEGKRLFSGIPAVTDSGIITIRITATDIEGGGTAVDFPIYTTYVPTFKKKIPDMQARAGHLFTWQISNGTVINLSERNTTMKLEQFQGIPNRWLALKGDQLYGIPNSSDVGTTQMNLVADDGVAIRKDLFNVQVIDNLPPQFSSRMSDQAIEVMEPFQFSLPSVMFIDGDGDALSYSVTLQDGSEIPNWIDFNKETLTFSGTAPRDATNNFAIREYEFLVAATDGQKKTEGSFRLKVGGASTVEKILEYVGYGLTALSFLFGVYRKRDLIWKYLGKKAYTVPLQQAVIGQEYSYSLSKRVVSCFVQRVDDKQEIPLDEFFGKELWFDGKDRCIRGTPSLQNRGEYTIIAYNSFGVRSRLFILNIETEEELQKNILKQDGGRKEFLSDINDLSDKALQEIKIDKVEEPTEGVSHFRSKRKKKRSHYFSKSNETRVAPAELSI